jgi:hypothetical protein
MEPAVGRSAGVDCINSCSWPAQSICVENKRTVKGEMLLYIGLTDGSRLSRINTFIEEHSVANPTIFFSLPLFPVYYCSPWLASGQPVGPSNMFPQSSNSQRSVLQSADLKREKQFFYKEIRQSTVHDWSLSLERELENDFKTGFTPHGIIESLSEFGLSSMRYGSKTCVCFHQRI